jgi:hypothetical protein
MKKITVNGEDEAFRLLKAEAEKYLNIGYKSIHVNTSVNENDKPCISIIPAELDTPAITEEKKEVEYEMPDLKILLGNDNLKSDDDSINSILTFKSDDIKSYSVDGEGNTIVIYLKVGSIVRDKNSGRAYVIKDSKNEVVAKTYIPEHKHYLMTLDENLAQVTKKGQGDRKESGGVPIAIHDGVLFQVQWKEEER